MARRREPDIRTALTWWTEISDKWTPVGWKDHLFRFNIFFNGTILAQPDLNNRTEAYKGQGVQISFPWLGHAGDDGTTIQGWNDCAAPVLWTEWPKDGCLIRQEVFGYLPGAKDTVSGVEPLYAWVRLSVHDTCSQLPLEDSITLSLVINSPHVGVSMAKRNNVRYDHARSQYPRALRLDAESGGRLVEEDGKVRLAIAPSQECRVELKTGKPLEGDYLIEIELPVRKGAHVDLLLPMLPAEKSELDAVLNAGYDFALKEANRYWSPKPTTAATFDCPEDYINSAISRNLRMAEIIAERDPATGICSVLSGSFQYTSVWATPTSMAITMFLDTMGYHSVVEKYLAVFKREQGTVVPPGASFKLHPGYLSTPKSLASINWLTDHGALLWAISEHALLSGDDAFARDWEQTIVKACEFIRDARAIRGHGGVEGLMPPAVASDMQTQIQGTWTDGWNYKGLVTALRFLKRIGHPKAAEFDAEARAYRTVFRRAIKAKAAGTPGWTDERGKQHHFAPVAMYGERKMEARHEFYLDAGPLFLVFSGLMDARDELMKSLVKWFREGPQTKWYRYDGQIEQLPCLVHEMSTCEPCYSWNVFHSHQLGDRAHFLEGMYSLFAGAYSQQTFSVCETRGGIAGTCHWLPSVYLARLAVVDDQIAEDELHLLRLMPTAWLREDRESRFEDVPTEFGPVSLRVRLADGGKELHVDYSNRFTSEPRRVVLHVPPVRGLGTVVLNGRALPQAKMHEIGNAAR